VRLNETLQLHADNGSWLSIDAQHAKHASLPQAEGQLTPKEGVSILELVDTATLVRTLDSGGPELAR
jgi:hypothetical protein